MTGILALGIGLEIVLPFLKEGWTTGFKPSSVLILGGSSALGAAVIQLLRLAIPACAILATSSPKHHSHITKLGDDKVFDRNSVSLISDVNRPALDLEALTQLLMPSVLVVHKKKFSIYLIQMGPRGMRRYGLVMTRLKFPVVWTR